MRKLLLEQMKRTGDPALEAFQNRDDPAKILRFMEDQRQKAKRK